MSIGFACFPGFKLTHLCSIARLGSGDILFEEPGCAKMDRKENPGTYKHVIKVFEGGNQSILSTSPEVSRC